MNKSEIIKLSTFILIIFMILSYIPVFSEGFAGFNLIIDDTPLNKEISAFTLEGITYIPLSKVVEKLGVTIRQEGDTLTIYRQDITISLKIMQEKAFLEVKGRLSDNYAYIRDKTVYVPVLYLVDYLGFDVEVLYDIRCIRIITKKDILLAGQVAEDILNPKPVAKQSPEADRTDDKGYKTAYLTFDDGLDSKVTPQVLDILKQYDIKATFFILGNSVSKHKDILNRIIEEGHNIGNHTYTHKKEIIYTDVIKFSEELDRTTKAIYDAVGIKTKLFRPPYGAPYIRSKEYKDALSDYKVVLWNVDSMDSRIKGIKSSEIVAAVKSQLKNKNNAIILFHSTSAREETAKALPEVIQYLIDNGFIIERME